MQSYFRLRCHLKAWRLAGLVLCLFIVTLPACERSRPEISRPDVLLVVLDTVRADRVSALGYSRQTTPNFDVVAREGILFTDVTAPGSWTWPSHASLFTGTLPHVHQAHRTPIDNLSEGLKRHGIHVNRLRQDLPTLAEHFAAAGYRTVSIASNPWLSPDLGLTRGFEMATTHDSDKKTISVALEELKSNDKRPLFMFLNLMSAHSPYLMLPAPWAGTHQELLEKETAPEWAKPYWVRNHGIPGIDLERGVNDATGVSGVVRYLRGELKIPPEGLLLLSDLYDRGVRGADVAFGKVLASWVKTRPEGIIAVTSDHGEYLGEHGMLSHGLTVYSQVVKVPLALLAPDRSWKGRRVDTPVNLQDVYTILLELTGLTACCDKLNSLLKGSANKAVIAAEAWADRGVSIHTSKPCPVFPCSPEYSPFKQSWRLYREGSDALVFSSHGAEELYNLSEDPNMETDISSSNPKLVKSLRSAATVFFANESVSEQNPIEPDEELLNKLKALGYVQ